MSPSPPYQPSPPWRAMSSLIMGATGFLSRAFLYGCSNTEVVGLEPFLKLLDERKDVTSRERGLLTVSNHVSILDDPLIWGVLPFKYGFQPDNHRWSLASHDLCFQNKFTSTFFSFGQTLPIHRTRYSPHGGPFQPTMTEAIRLLSSQPFSSSPNTSYNPSSPDPTDISDPFTTPSQIYSTAYPSSYPSRRHSWIHIFPEGFIHQHPAVRMRYFKWGVARLILESEPLPTIIPIFISGTEQVMHESRTFPRFLPRTGKHIVVALGKEVDGEKVFGELRDRWRELVRREREAARKGAGAGGGSGMGSGNKAGIDIGRALEMEIGHLTPELKYGTEAVELRKEVTRRMRDEVLKVRHDLGFPDEDPKAGLVETWREEGSKREGRMQDGSWVRDA